MIYIGISVEPKSMPRVSDHNSWTANIHVKYDSSFWRAKIALKHTRKDKGNSKIALDPPPVALTYRDIDQILYL